MARVQAFGIFRQCRASLAPRHVPSPRILYSSRIGTRCYSEQKQNGNTEREEPAGSKTQEQSTESQKEGQTDPPSQDAAQSKESELEAKLKAKEAEAVDLLGRLRYLQADFLNLQRNSAREREQTRDFAISRFAGELLETLDVLSLALKSVPESVLKPSSTPPPETPETSPTAPSKTAQEYLIELHNGVELTHRSLSQTLFKYGVRPFDPTGDKFDPNLHEALYSAPLPDKEPGVVIECQKTGYMIKDRILRAAQVGISAASS